MAEKVFDLTSTLISTAALTIAALSLWDSHRKGDLLKDIATSLKYIARQPKTAKGSKTAKDQQTDKAVPAQKIQLQQQAEERRRLRDGLEREKMIWKRQKDIAKAIGWIIERLGEED